jgi:4-hydroxy-tetrahydrodipicolinate reductase
MTTLAITGAGGRMANRLLALAHADADLEVVASIARGGSARIDLDAGQVAGLGDIGLPVTDELVPTPAVLVDFTSPVAFRHWLKCCRDRGVAMVVGTTGLHADDHHAIDQAAGDIAIVQSPNMSLGVNLLFKVAAEVARALGDAYDKEIVEIHHRFKKDAPSGTAMGLADAILSAMGKTRESLVFDRHGGDVPRQPGQVGMHALRPWASGWS